MNSMIKWIRTTRLTKKIPLQESLLAGGPEAGHNGSNVPSGDNGSNAPSGAGHNGSNVAEAGPNSEDEETDGHVTHGPASGAAALSERLWRAGARRLVQVIDTYRVTSPIRNCLLLGPCSRPMPKALGWS